MTYELPMKDGEVDLRNLANDIKQRFDNVWKSKGVENSVVKVLETLAAHERARGAEKEREACAKLAATLPGDFDMRWREQELATPSQIADAIRTRGENEAVLLTFTDVPIGDANAPRIVIIPGANEGEKE